MPDMHALFLDNAQKDDGFSFTIQHADELAKTARIDYVRGVSVRVDNYGENDETISVTVDYVKLNDLLATRIRWDNIDAYVYGWFNGRVIRDIVTYGDLFVCE